MPNTEASTNGSRPARTRTEPSERSASSLSPPATPGQTFIADEVVSVVARLAAEQIEGVHQIGEPSFRAFLPGGSRHRGVEAEVGLEEAAVDIEIIVDFGHPIRQVAERMREHVIETVERMTGCRMVEVDIHVVDVNLPKVDRRPRRQLA